MLLLGTALAARAALVPGCPVQEDGRLSGCLLGKVGWAWALYEDGLVDELIVSGDAVYSPYEEATAMALALEALGVPPEHIWLEPLALHSDENAYNGMRIAQRQGWELVVASSPMQARGVCAYVRAWGEPCQAAGMRMGRLREVMLEHEDTLRSVLVPVDEAWVPLEQREAVRAEELGWERPPSGRLYVADTWRGLTRRPRTPYIPEGVDTLRCWADADSRPSSSPLSR